jgi:hypothetical protein
VERAQDHVVTIERRGRSHRAHCACGWESHAWNELRPAEADAWHHVYGEDVIVDVAEKARVPSGHAAFEAKRNSSSVTIEHLVRKAQDLAGEPSPYGKNAHFDLWDAAGHDPVAVRAAVAEVEELLANHNRQSLGTADRQWLELMTAKRLLLQALAVGDQSGRPGALL